VPDKNWGSAVIGLTAQLGPRLSGWIDYDGHLSDSNQKYNGFNVGLAYKF